METGGKIICQKWAWKKNTRYIRRPGWKMEQRHAQQRREYNQESEEKKQRQEDTGK